MIKVQVLAFAAISSLVSLAAGAGGEAECRPAAGFSVFGYEIPDYALFHGLTLAEAAKEFKAAGITGFESSYSYPNIAELVKEGLKPVSLYGDVEFLSGDGGEKQMDDFIAAAIRWKVKQVMVLPDEFSGADDEKDFARIVAGFNRFIEKARGKGITVMTEDYGHQKKFQNPCGHVKWLSRLFKECPGLMFAIDTGNLMAEGREAILQIARPFADRIVHCHLKDKKTAEKGGGYVTLGLGDVPNLEIVRFLHGRGYDGWYTLENLVGGDSLVDVKRQMAVLSQWLGDVPKTRWARTFDYLKPDKTPVVFGGWSRGWDVAAEEYCIYLDIRYEDGDLVYGPRVSWRLGTHGWEEAKGVFVPRRPIKQIKAYAFLRKGDGRAEFRDCYLERRDPYAGEAFHPGTQSDRPYANRVETLWDELKNGKIVTNVSYVDSKEPATSPIAAGSFRIWTADASRCVTPLTFPSDSESEKVALEIAGRESESFQICISTAADVEWTDGGLVLPKLKDRQGRPFKGSVKWERVGYIPHRPGYFTRWTKYGPPSDQKWFPDPLLPAAPYRVRPASTQGLWVTVRADPDAAAGDYFGEIAATEKGVRKGSVKIGVRVRDFSLPATFGLKTAFSLMDGCLRQIYGEKRMRGMKTQAIDVMLDHRLNPDDISRFTVPEIKDLLHARDRGMNLFNILNVVPLPKNKSTAYVLYSTPEETGSDEFYRDFKARLDPFVAQIRANGLVDMAYVYGFDEREENYFKGIDTFWRRFKKDFPDIPLMTTAKMYQYLADGKTNVANLVTTDWYCPCSHRWSDETTAMLHSKGKKVFWYTCCTPTPPYANSASVEWCAADGRILLGGMTWLKKADGFLFWHVNAWRPSNGQMDESDTYFSNWRTLEAPVSWPSVGCAGDGVYIYPGKENVLPSIRLALIRDGVEDYEWLSLAEAKSGRAAVEALVAPTVRSLTDFERDPAKLRAVRSRVGRLVETSQSKK